MKSAYQIIRRPVITEKGLGVKETEATLVFEVAAEGQQDGDQAGGAEHFQGEGGLGAYRDIRRQRASPGQVYRLPSRLEEGVCAVEDGAEDARVRREYLVAFSPPWPTEG